MQLYEHLIILHSIIIIGSIGYYLFSSENQAVSVVSEQQTHEQENEANHEGAQQENALENGYHNHTLEETTINWTEQQFIEWENNEEIQILRHYLRIPTVHPDINYSKIIFHSLNEKNFYKYFLYIYSGMCLLFGKYGCEFESFSGSSLSSR